jgi:triphosphatase
LAQRRHEVSTYFDTRDLALARLGVSLRVRCTNGQCVQTLKAEGRSGVAADRAEWEWPLANDTPDFDLLAQTSVAEKLRLASRSIRSS